MDEEVSFWTPEFSRVLRDLVRWDIIFEYRKTSNIRRSLVGNEIADHSDVVGAAPVQLHLHSRLNIWFQGIRQRQPQDSTRIY